MRLNDTQIKLLTEIQIGLKHGDINLIAEKSGFSRTSVSRVLSLSFEDFNEEIVKIATIIISQRNENNSKLLKKII
jgi:hypothetical protein